ncbi:hypothetical protein [Erwinia persicina]|uniref:hypothetical protein n=1 Tax=Erwinia persicina TaxID=55211 RepID=UPI0017810D3B|nr:hypothetical protein [Erwinia persicina]MBD8161633.1 hypothetical protein [Erwinia persicina]MBD8212924.1 hypothetical protein [Erwinia persicina]
MMIWSGVGFFIAVFISIAYVICQWLFDVFWPVGYYSAHLWTVGVTLILSATLSLALVLALRKEAFILLIARMTDSRPMYQAEITHQFFFVPVRYWPLILFLTGVGLCMWEMYGK